MVKMAECVLDRAENSFGKGENTGNQHFSFFHNVFSGCFSRVVKTMDCLVKGQELSNLKRDHKIWTRPLLHGCAEGK